MGCSGCDRGVWFEGLVILWGSCSSTLSCSAFSLLSMVYFEHVGHCDLGNIRLCLTIGHALANSTANVFGLIFCCATLNRIYIYNH